MAKSKKNVASPPLWSGCLWIALSLLAILLGAMWSLAAAGQFHRWLYADHYVAAELEVTRFTIQAEEESESTIEGVIHPGGETVVTTAKDIPIWRFDSRTGIGHMPSRTEIEGQRLPVWYWPRHAEVKRWWHPPTVIKPDAIRESSVVARNLLIGVAFVVGGLFGFRRGARQANQSPVPPGKP